MLDYLDWLGSRWGRAGLVGVALVGVALGLFVFTRLVKSACPEV